jgi:carbamoyl-phosphate synthase small subunit
MTGYQEVLTDPSYAGQLVTLTYPMVGNYGINKSDFESRRIQAAGLIVRQHCDVPSHSSSEMTLDAFLQDYNIPGISGIDTRALTRRLRTRGVMMGGITIDSPDEALRQLADVPRYDDLDLVSTVTTETGYFWNGLDESVEYPRGPAPQGVRRILVTDAGLKYNILRLLRSRGCEVIAVPATTPASDLLALHPSGVLLSPGPGDPVLLAGIVDNVRQLVGKVPVMGICLGHQLAARALGARTYKLKFGHRGGNHPVKDLISGQVHITAQNHGYAVDSENLPAGLQVSHLNLNDNTVEGLIHRDLPLFTIQYHSEASPGPQDNEYLFDRFLSMIDDAN